MGRKREEKQLRMVKKEMAKETAKEILFMNLMTDSAKMGTTKPLLAGRRTWLVEATRANLLAKTTTCTNWKSRITRPGSLRTTPPLARVRVPWARPSFLFWVRPF